MKIAAAPADFEGCGTYRVLLPYRRLRSRGHEVAILLRPQDPRLFQADVLVIQRQSDPRIFDLVKTCRAGGMPVVYELDDNLHSLSPMNPASRWYGPEKPATKMVERFMAEVDALIVSTRELAREYSSFNSNIFVCPNALEDTHVEAIAPPFISGELKRHGQVRIGWAGSFTHRADISTIVPSLVEVMRADERVRFISIGDCFIDMFPVDLRQRVEWIAGCRTSLSLNPDLIRDDLLGLFGFYHLAVRADLDIALAPLEHTPFNRCKSDIKVKEYAIFGVPVIASNFGPYATYAARATKQVIALARERSDWVSTLLRLINSRRGRAELAQANLEHVRRQHLLSQVVERWEYALTSIATQRASKSLAQDRRIEVDHPRAGVYTGTSRTAGPLLVNDAGLLGDALSALPIIHRLAMDTVTAGARLKVMLVREEILSLLPPAFRRQVDVVPWKDDPRAQAGIPANRIIRLDVLTSLRRYGRFLHMMQAHYAVAGYGYTDFGLPPLDPGLNELGPAYDIVISPFSRSDGGSHQKVWPIERWQKVISVLSKRFSICVLAQSEGDHHFEDADAFYGQPLRDVAGAILKARAVLTIDNGISHLTHLLRAPHLLLYPATLPFCWVRNTNGNAMHLVGHPLSIPPEALLKAFELLPVRRAADGAPLAVNADNINGSHSHTAALAG